ncbi:hypothetical protein VTK73DRAFT_6702 [Phialemonium thermophilum]|uniref:Uncharacterized protein n=1 Tax=Phialemonium thermophilum TaxID=223376 RepID=A0ABR3XW67_9PEZI
MTMIQALSNASWWIGVTVRCVRSRDGSCEGTRYGPRFPFWHCSPDLLYGLDQHSIECPWRTKVQIGCYSSSPKKDKNLRNPPFKAISVTLFLSSVHQHTNLQNQHPIPFQNSAISPLDEHRTSHPIPSSFCILDLAIT